MVSGLGTGGTGHERRKARRQILTKTTAHAPFLATYRTPEPDRLQPGPLFCFSTVQDIACGIDRSGKDVKITNLQTTLQRSCKYRGFQLYLWTELIVQDSHRPSGAVE